MTESWVDKHRPENWGDLQGNNKAIKSIRAWVDDWSPGDSPQLLVGPPGTGKTSTAEVVARKLNLQTHSINASDARGGDDLQAMADSIRSVSEQGRKLVLLDEVDSWHHAVKRGSGAKALYDALSSSANPVILTANDEYDVPNAVTNRCDVHEFSLQKRSRRAKLRKIADAEDVDLTDDELDRLADRPDLRSAINDLQVAAGSDLPPPSDDREWSMSEWDMVDNILNGPDHGEKDTGDIAPPDVVLWLDENISAEYRGLELAMAYEALSLADVWLGKAQQTREYRFWAYAAQMAESVNLLRRTEPYKPESGVWSKGFPEWFRHSEPKPDGSDATATLYRDLKDKGGRFTFAGGFHEFRETILPLLQQQDLEDRYRLAHAHGVSDDALDALNIDSADYESWVLESAPETGEWTGTQHAAEW